MALRRRQLKLKQSELAARVGMSRASIANIECGRQNVLLHHAYDIAAVLGVQVGDLLPGDAKPSLEDQSLTLSLDTVTARGKSQITDLIANALATAKAKP